ncbi:aldo/keto reductase [Chitinophaga sancti]|uniref:Aldo/keto reductase n=1 Tax=Chitinophaga sancti TaxID=1004 RepID=A0A1K1Q7M1_9BACT|nr:aldo/keto reductase [Chitinophaga sancti]WQD61143.1 aldo/keto reductase [Chitinophaga sancti]WQG86730.1 aldo/keto reductase [Chitinophaga sancti]SFW55134.1 Predicted oxidoreductase [Chitinophaga sancti]
MKYNTLGKSDLQISEIAFGCMSLGENALENTFLVHRALEKGINFFDTADLYNHGDNEVQLGLALKGKRDKAVIATKVGNQWKADKSSWDWNPSKEYILRSVDESLRRLGTDYIDLYQLHGGMMEDPIDETIAAFEQLQQAGKIRYYGISSIRPNVIREYIKRSNIVSVMMQYSLLDRRPEESCLELLKSNNIGVLARGGVAKGLLAGKHPESYLNYDAAAVAKAALAIANISGKGRTLAQTALRFVLHQPAIAAAVVGIRTQNQLEEAAGVFTSAALTPQEINALQQAIQPSFYDQHR